MKFGAVIMTAASALAATSTAWEMTTWADFARGRFEGLSLSRDGRLTLAPKLETLFASGQPAVWTMVQGPRGEIYLGTGHRGELHRVDPSGASALLWTAPEPEIFALAMGPGGVLYAGTSPGGKVYRVENGKATEYFNPGARYIWSLAVGRDGVLYVGTGDQGKVFAVREAGKGEPYYDTAQGHVTALAFDTGGRLLAGTEPNGILYRIAAKDKAFVLYDSSLPEIRSIVPMPDGAIYVAALGGTIAKRSASALSQGAGAAAQGAITAPTTSITVTEEAQAGLDLRPKQQAGQQPAAQAGAAALPVIQTVEYAGVEKSALYRVHPDNTVDTLWTSKEENIFDLVEQSGRLLFSTDGQGRIYGFAPDRQVTLIAQTNESEATRLALSPSGLLASTGNLGKLYRLTDALGTAGSYESPVHDAQSVARWGRLRWRGDVPQGARIVFRTRTGNSARPDRTWSEWTQAPASPLGAAIVSPNARFIQWRAEIAAPAGASPVLDSVSVAYLPQNQSPAVRAITVTTQLLANQAAAAKVMPAAQQAAASYSITVTDTGEPGASTASGTPVQTQSRAGARQLTIAWQADDPESDQLVYSLSFRGVEERQWKPIRSNLTESSFLLDADVLADGEYYFRVRASDRPSNAPAFAREAELVSAPVLVDNTPPVISFSSGVRANGRFEIDFEAADGASPLRRCEYSLDAGPWTVLEAADGVTDSLAERFRVAIENLSPAEHLVVVRVYDAAGNAGLGKTLVREP